MPPRGQTQWVRNLRAAGRQDAKPAWLAGPGQSRAAYSIERNGQSRSSQARTAW